MLQVASAASLTPSSLAMLDAAKPECIIHSLCVQYSCCCYHLHPFACMPHQVWRKHYVLTDQRPDSVRRKKPETRVSTLTGITQKKEAKEMPTTNAKKKKNHVSTKQSRAEQERKKHRQSRAGEEEEAQGCAHGRRSALSFVPTATNVRKQAREGGTHVLLIIPWMHACIRSDPITGHRPR